MTETIKDKWEKGKNTTLRFYRLKLQWKVAQFNHKFPLLIYFAPMIGDKKEVSIADLGAGMFSTIGCLWHGADVHITSSDILADEYKQILDEYKIIPLFPIEKQDMERLTYGDCSFDIVHCVNALDHCVNPHKALQEMYRVCKPGGWIYLRHYLNGGEQRKYQGLHQWNICPTDDGDCLFFSGDDKFLLSDFGWRFYNPILAQMKKEIGNEPEMVVSTLHKKGNV